MKIANKVCSTCKVDKSIDFFNKNSSKKYGINSACKDCIKIEAKKTYLKHKESRLLKVKAYRKIKPKDKLYSRNYYAKNKQKILNNHKKYRDNNREHYLNYWRQYRKRKNSEDINYKIKSRLRVRFNCAVKRNYKAGSAIKDLGCSIEFLKDYISKMFKPGMTWENWSYYTWHLDHIIPLCRFNLSDPKEFKKAAHYTNLQPLWAKENMSKNKYDLKINLGEDNDKKDT